MMTNVLVVLLALVQVSTAGGMTMRAALVLRGGSGAGSAADAANTARSAEREAEVFQNSENPQEVAADAPATLVAGTPESTPAAPTTATTPVAAAPATQKQPRLSPEGLGFLSELSQTYDLSIIYRMCENIPAILHCSDKAMAIHEASLEDALLASHVIHRIANVSSEIFSALPQGQCLSRVLENDRRFVQLTELVELKLEALTPIDLARYLWGLTVLGVEEDQIKLTLAEYTRRNPNPETFHKDELAAMMWTVGCVKSTFGWTDEALFKLLSDALKSNACRKLRPKLLVRVLWAHLIYEKDDQLYFSRSLDYLSRHADNLSGSDSVTLLSLCAKFRLMDDHWLSVFLDRYKPHVEKGNMVASAVSLSADALSTLISNLNKNPSPVLEGMTQVGHRLVQTVGAARDVSTLSVASVTNLLRLASALKVRNSPMYDSALAFLNKSFEVNEPIPMEQAASLLESIASIAETQLSVWVGGNSGDKVAKTSTDTSVDAEIEEETETVTEEEGDWAREEMKEGRDKDSESEVKEAKKAVEVVKGDAGVLGTETIAASNEECIPGDKSGPSLLRYNTNWHRVVGRLGAVCATGMADEPDERLIREDKINACWAVASFGHPYRALMREAQRAVKGHLDELSPENTARVGIALAMEESSASGGVGGGGPGAKVERRFMDEVVASVLSSAQDLPDLSSKVKALVAVTHLGRVSMDLLRLPLAPLSVSQKDLEQMPTELLVQFFWALGRLPEDMTAEGTVDAVSAEIETRCLSTPAESILYVRALADAHAGRRTLPANIASDVDAKSRMILDNLIAPLSALEEGRDTALRAKGKCPDVAAVCETLQALIELGWYHENTAELCARFTMDEKSRLLILDSSCSSRHGAQHKHHGSDCDQAFDLGRLEKLLLIYKAIPAGRGRRRSAFQAGRKLFSSFFNRIGLELS